MKLRIYFKLKYSYNILIYDTHVTYKRLPDGRIDVNLSYTLCSFKIICKRIYTKIYMICHPVTMNDFEKAKQQ